MKKTILALGLLALSIAPAVAASAEDGAGGKGEIIATVFVDFKTGFGSTNGERGFGFGRGYLGYDYKFNNGVELKAVADLSNVGAGKGLIKNAFAKWAINDRWSIEGGLISTTQFNAQEKFWGKRYVMKSFQDEYKFGSSADLGISASHKFGKVVSADVIIVNGNGYKELQVGRGLQYGGGVTITPDAHWLIRLYGSYNEQKQQKTNGVTNAAAFVGYRRRGFSIGGEYNYQWTTDCEAGKDKSGFSVYATGKVAKKCDIFARYDYLTSRSGWNAADAASTNDGQSIIAGVEIPLFKKHVSLSPNFLVRMPKLEGEKVKSYFCVSAAYNL